MGFSLSPSVSIIERDLSLTIPAVATQICGMVGEFEWGQVNVRTPLTNDRQLFDEFGDPNNTNYKSWFSAFNFLQYGNTLLIVRAINETTALNGGLMLQDDNALDKTPIPNTAQILNDDEAESAVLDGKIIFGGANDRIHILAKYPGAVADEIKVAVANDTDFPTANVTTGVEFVDQFEFAPEANEIAIVVLVNDEIEERSIVSLEPGAKNDSGINIYINDYIFQNSAWIVAYENTTSIIDVASNEAAVLAGGVNDSPTNTEIHAGFDLYSNPEEVDVSMIIDGAWNNSLTHQYIIDNLLPKRLDAVAYLTVPQDDVVGVTSVSTAVSNCVDYRKNLLSRSTSYAALSANWKYQEDSFNGVFRWLPVSADVAGTQTATAESREPWIASAGYNRGNILNTIKFAINPDLGFRDLLYKDGCNPLLVDAADGPVLLGQKTLLTRPSSFDRLDVRWLFIVMEKAIATASKFFMFEKNTPFTRRQFKGIVDPFLRDIQGREGIEQFEVQVDENINTPEVRARNEFRARIFVQPTLTAEFIILEFVNVKSGVDFTETISKSA
jgi:hypothetical protein